MASVNGITRNIFLNCSGLVKLAILAIFGHKYKFRAKHAFELKFYSMDFELKRKTRLLILCHITVYAHCTAFTLWENESSCGKVALYCVTVSLMIKCMIHQCALQVETLNYALSWRMLRIDISQPCQILIGMTCS